MLKRYFELELSRFGFEPESMELTWSIGFCQSDFVSFTGHISNESIRKLMMKMHGIDVGPSSDEHPLCPDDLHYMLKVLEAYGSNDLRFVSYGARNPVVYVETEDDFEWIFDYYFQTITDYFNDTIEWDKNRQWNKEWFAFLKWLKQAHQDLCEELRTKASEILLCQSTNSIVRQIRSENCSILFIETDLVDDGFMVDHMDDDDALRFFDSLIKSKKRYGSLQVKILDRETNRLLGSSCHYDFVRTSKGRDSAYLELQRMALREAAEDTRELFSRHIKKA